MGINPGLFRIVAIFFLLIFSSDACLYAANAVVVVNKQNSQSNISSSELSRIYQGKKTSWSDGSNIMPINHPVGSAIRKTFYKKILNSDSAAQFYQPNNPIPFKTLVQQSGLAVKRLVSRMPNTIGYIDAQDIDDTVKILTVNNLDPASKDYPIHD